MTVKHDTVNLHNISASTLGGAYYIQSTGNIDLELYNTNINTCQVGTSTQDPTVMGGMAYLYTTAGAYVNITQCSNIAGIYSAGYGGLIEVN